MPGRRDASIDLPVPGGPIISKLWAACSSEFEGALGRLLPLDVAKVGIVRGCCKRCRHWRRLKLRTLEMIDERKQVGGCHDLAAAGPGGL